jgi:cytochrome b561
LPASQRWLADIRRDRARGGGIAMKAILVARYHPLLVAPHWLLAILIIAMLGAGFFLLARMPNSDPRKISILTVHMSVGMLILLLMTVRLVVRMRTSRAPDSTTGLRLLDRLAPVVHYGFYGLVLLMVATGYATAILAGLNRIVFQRSGEPLPSSFETYPTFTTHGYLALMLTGLIILHLAAALCHQLARKDRLLQRMWFGHRVSDSAGRMK